MRGFTKKGVYSPDQKIPLTQKEAITTARQEGRNAAFHGACHGCLNQQGNTSGEGMRYCLGCAYAGYYDYGENRRLVGDE